VQREKQLREEMVQERLQRLRGAPLSAEEVVALEAERADIEAQLRQHRLKTEHYGLGGGGAGADGRGH